jgi:hypothetical protein
MNLLDTLHSELSKLLQRKTLILWELLYLAPIQIRAYAAGNGQANDEDEKIENLHRNL